MIMTRTASVLLMAFLPLVDSRAFLSSDRGVDAASIHQVVQGTLDEVFGSGHGVDSARMAKIKATLEPLFSVLPKNGVGRLDSPFMRYAIQRYFSERHGWIVKGFEPHADKVNVSETQAANVLHTQVPGYVEAVLKKTLSDGGFLLQDIVIAVASIERLIFDDGLKSVESAFYLNKLSTTQPLTSKASLTEVLISFFIIEHLDCNASDVSKHNVDKGAINLYYPHWPETLKFIEDIAGDDAFQQRAPTNPFVERTFSFEDVARITQTISERFGPLSNHECHDMKLKLAEMDVHGTGRVKLADFYRSSKGGAWQFLETSEYLASIGALDSSSDFHGPQVIIANYITGMNNCISSSLYYDICCLNECDGIFQHMEAKIRSPTATAIQITKVIEGGIALSPLLSSTAPVEPRNLSTQLRSRLGEIADRHGDAIPLHGRLFAQWLHYAFPQECPFPHVTGTISPSSMTDLKNSNVALSASSDEMVQFIESEAGRRAPSPEAGRGMWSLHEELLVPSSRTSSWLSLPRSAVHVVMMVFFSGLILKELMRLFNTVSMSAKQRKEEAASDGSYYI